MCSARHEKEGSGYNMARGVVLWYTVPLLVVPWLWTAPCRAQDPREEQAPEPYVPEFVTTDLLTYDPIVWNPGTVLPPVIPQEPIPSTHLDFNFQLGVPQNIVPDHAIDAYSSVKYEEWAPQYQATRQDFAPTLQPLDVPGQFDPVHSPDWPVASTSPMTGDPWGSTAISALDAAFDNLSTSVPDPAATWVQRYNEDLIAEMGQTWVDAAVFSVCPSIFGATLGTIGLAASVLEPSHPNVAEWTQRGTTALGLAKNVLDNQTDPILGWAGGTMVKQALFNSDFDASAEIRHSSSHTLNETWHDDLRHTYMSADITVGKSFIPDLAPTYWDEFAPGTTIEWRQLNQDAIYMETIGIQDLHSFVDQWNLDIQIPTSWDAGSYSPNSTTTWHNYELPSYQPPVTTTPSHW